MVKIPKLAEDGQNWKIYHAKFLKVAATFNCLEVLAGRPYEGDDWDGCNALLCCTFMELPIDGELNECKQEAADSMVTAGHTKRTVETAEPTTTDINSEKAALDGELVERACRVNEGDEMDVDVDRTVVLGGEPAETVCGVDEGDGDQTCQCNGNVENNIPSAYGLPLEGEWSVYPSSESEMLVITSIESEDPDSGGIPCVHLRDMSWQTGDANCPGNQADGIESQMDVSSGHSDMPSIETNPTKPENETEIPIRRWRSVSIEDIDVYVPWNAPIEVLGQAFEFGEVESAGKAIAPIVKGERAGDGNGG
ncbi:hypothetical protein SCLCIDRAFT_24903 [Scleroderma citrinum Foug A]|uniref:Uncharacterized protein n=1 Tax=Scleroderma citrinum Foug A TaxID=1036808 RepID=A0A0C3E2A3_9AGAM|nr:hypothetical protein SCLCIDRAFT_24903 [Scleroderma citrinum Foug A]